MSVSVACGVAAVLVSLVSALFHFARRGAVSGGGDPEVGGLAEAERHPTCGVLVRT